MLCAQRLILAIRTVKGYQTSGGTAGAGLDLQTLSKRADPR